MKRSVLLLCAFFIFHFVAPAVGDDDLDPDTYNNVTQLITARVCCQNIMKHHLQFLQCTDANHQQGYPCEQYYATTEDGFILR